MSMTVAREWQHKSVKALVRAGHGKDPDEIIREKARSLVARAKCHGWAGPPFKPEVLASICGIRCEGSRGLFTSEAQLTPLPNRQLLLEFNPDRPDGRRNYSICHEIAHTFFDDCYEIVHHRRSSPSDYGAESEIELLCQIGAAELLMPLEDFQSDMETLALSLRSVAKLTERYGASREAVLRRMISVVDSPCAVVFLSKRLSKTERRKALIRPLIKDAFEAPKPRMRILYTVPHPSFGLYLPANKSVPDDSCVYSAVESFGVIAQVEQWSIDGFGKRLVEAMDLPVPTDADESAPTVAALVHPQY